MTTAMGPIGSAEQTGDNKRCGSVFSEIAFVWMISAATFTQGIYELHVLINKYDDANATERAQMGVFYLGAAIMLLQWCPQLGVACMIATLNIIVTSTGIVWVACAQIKGECVAPFPHRECIQAAVLPLLVHVSAVSFLVLLLSLSSRCRGKARYSDTCTTSALSAMRMASGEHLRAQQPAMHQKHPGMSLDAALADGQNLADWRHSVQQQPAPNLSQQLPHSQHSPARRFEFKLTPSSVALASLSEPLSARGERMDRAAYSQRRGCMR
jgi:hypothetical protein